MHSSTPVFSHLTTLLTSKMILFFILLLLYISLMTHHPALTVLTLFALLTAGGSYAWSRSAASGLSVNLTLDNSRVFAGETVKIRISVKNRKLLPVWVRTGITFDDGFIHNGLSFVDSAAGTRTEFLLWYGRSSLQWEIRAEKRGYYNLSTSAVTVADPLFFYPRQIRFDTRSDLIVFPGISPINPFPLKEKHFFGSPGARSPVHDPVYILGTREYQTFTPVKMIHWKASARMGSLQEKVCEPSVQGKLLIVLDVDGFQGREQEPDFESMIETAVSIACHYENRERAVGFVTNAAMKGGRNGYIPIGRGNDTLSGILETAACLSNRPISGIPDVLEHTRSRLRGIQVVLCRSSLPLSPDGIGQVPGSAQLPAVVLTAQNQGEDSGPDIFWGNHYTMNSVRP